MRATIAFSAVALVLGAASLGATAEVHGKGHAAYVVRHSDSHELAGGTTVIRQASAGILFADDPANPLHLSSQDCSGTIQVGAEGPAAAGYCDGVTPGGDLWWIWWKGSDHGTWGFLRGTGKLAGIEGGGTWKRVADHGDRNSNEWEGTWTTK